MAGVSLTHQTGFKNHQHGLFPKMLTGFPRLPVTLTCTDSGQVLGLLSSQKYSLLGVHGGVLVLPSSLQLDCL